MRTQSNLKSATEQHGCWVIRRPALPGFCLQARELPDKSCKTNHFTQFKVAPTRRCEFWRRPYHVHYYVRRFVEVHIRPW